jgi:signal transduction histidine kinase
LITNKGESFNEYRINFLRISCWYAFFLQIIYLFLYIYKHNANEYIPIFLCGLGLTSISFFFLRLKKYTQSVIFFLATALIVIPVLVASGGGFSAPGIHWLSIIPMLFVVFFGRRGTYLGIVFFTLALLFIETVPLTNVITSPEMYQSQKTMNFLVFSLFVLIFVYSYSSSLEKYEKGLFKNTEKIDYLLKTLLHDISNPIQVLSLVVPRVKKDLNKTMYEKIEKNVDSIINILQDVKRIEGAQSSQEELVLERISVHDLLLGTDILFSEKLAEKDLKLVCKHSLNPKSTFVSVDHSIFKHHVLSNLITNAIKFSHLGSKVVIESSVIDNQVLIDIRDYGVGMSQEKIDSLFDIYSKTSTIGTSGEKGTGFGLPLVKFFLDKHNSTIEVLTVENSADIDSGCCFRISLKSQT